MKKSMVARFLIPIALCLATLLTGCVDYDVGINFATPYSGEITQHLKVSDKLGNLAPADTKRWLNSIEKRSRKLGGKIEKLDSQELLLTIPFGNGAELARKFNRLFQTNIIPNATIPKDTVDLVRLNSHISIRQNNLVFFERNRLNLTIDLRSLGVLSQQDKIIISPDSLANLKFQLTTSGIARNVSKSNNLQPLKTTKEGLVWQLQPGEVNQIDVVFWLPSPIGISAAAIAVSIVLGYLLKYRRFPGVA